MLRHKQGYYAGALRALRSAVGAAATAATGAVRALPRRPPSPPNSASPAGPASCTRRESDFESSRSRERLVRGGFAAATDSAGGSSGPYRASMNNP